MRLSTCVTVKSCGVTDDVSLLDAVSKDAVVRAATLTPSESMNVSEAALSMRALVLRHALVKQGVLLMPYAWSPEMHAAASGGGSTRAAIADVLGAQPTTQSRRLAFFSTERCGDGNPDTRHSRLEGLHRRRCLWLGTPFFQGPSFLGPSSPSCVV